MSERWWRHRKKRRRDPRFNDIIDEFDRIERMMDEMMHQAFQTPSSERRAKRMTRKEPYVYDFSMTVGPDGKPIIKEYQNVKPNRQQSRAHIREVKTETEPLIDILEHDKEITIVAQLPGAKKEDIRVHVAETQTTISADIQEHTYCKKLQLPAIVDPKSTMTSYKNGVLQIRLQKMPLARIPLEE